MQNERFSPFFGSNRRLWLLMPFFFVAAFLAFGLIVQALWNWILPELLGAKTIDFPRALGLLALCRILFGGFGGGGRGGRKQHFREKMRQKWQSMSDEERTEFKARWREKCQRPGG